MRGRLSIDLHLLRKAEALSVLETVLYAIRRRQVVVGAKSRALSPLPTPTRASFRGVDAAGNSLPAEAETVPSTSGAGGVSVAATAANGAEAGVVYREAFTSFEVVVGRGAHSIQGVSRLKPVVARYLAGRRFQVAATGGEKGEGVVLVSLVGARVQR